MKPGPSGCSTRCSADACRRGGEYSPLQGRLADGDRIWLVTTNDNLDALRFYQRRGFSLCALRAGAVDDSRRRLKPSISLTGAYGIPLRDELEFELRTSR